MLHILNKRQFVYEDNLDGEVQRDFKKNLIVMGDLLEDVKMVDPSRHETVLKVGFMNDWASEKHLLEDFMNTFDVVIVGDGSLQPVNLLISNLFKEQLDSPPVFEELSPAIVQGPRYKTTLLNSLHGKKQEQEEEAT